MDPFLASARTRVTRDLEQLRDVARRSLGWTRWPRRHPWLTLAGAALAGLALSRALGGRRTAARTRRAAGGVTRLLGSTLAGLVLRWGTAAVEAYVRRRLGQAIARGAALHRPDPHATMPPSPGG